MKILLYILLPPIYPLSRSIFRLYSFPIISNCYGLHLSRNVMGTPIIPLHPSFDENSCVCLFSVNGKSVTVSWVIRNISIKPDDLELFRIIFVEECDWDSHNAVTSCA